MEFTNEAEKMIQVLKENQNKFFAKNIYFTPDITEQEVKNIIKYYDNNIIISKVLAFFDTTLVAGNGKNGYVFTTDGFYYRAPACKPFYCRYDDIVSIDNSEEELIIKYKGILKGQKRIIVDYMLSIVTGEYENVRHMFEYLKTFDSYSDKLRSGISGEVHKTELSPKTKAVCNKIIRIASVSCGTIGAGLAQLPCSDSLLIIPVQITMIQYLGDVFNLKVSETAAYAVIKSAFATVAGRAATQFLLGWMPLIGNIINTATAAGLTEAIGWIAVNDFYDRWLQEQNNCIDDGKYINSGKYIGGERKDGYIQASDEYATKFKEQGDRMAICEEECRKMQKEMEKIIAEYKMK